MKNRHIIPIYLFIVSLILLTACGGGGSGSQQSGTQTIIYKQEINNQSHLYAIKTDGTGHIKLSSDSIKSDSFEAMAPGNIVIFSRWEKDTNSNRINRDIYTVNLDGTNLSALANSAEEEFFHSITVSGRIIYSINTALYSIALDGSDPQQLAMSASYRTITIDNKVIYQTAGNTFIIPADNSATAIQLSNSTSDEFSSLTADGKVIFLGGDISSAAGTIYSVNLDGTGMKILTAKAGYNYFKAITQSGRVIYAEYVNQNDWDIYSVNTDGSNHQPLATTSGFSEQFYKVTPNNNVIYQANNLLYAINADATGSLVQLTNSMNNVQVLGVTNSSEVIYLQHVDVVTQYYDLYIVDINGNNRTILASDPDSWQSLVRVITNNKIIYSSHAGKGPTHGDIYVVDTNGSNRRILAADPNVRERFWAITSNTSVIYLSNDGIDTDIFSVDLNGNNRKKLTHSGGKKSWAHLY